MLEHLRPLYARQFRCLGSQCEDNCCRNWEVAVDKDSYERFQRNPTLQPRLQEYFSVLTDSATARRHAIIRFTESSSCPFLSPERLCTLHQQYGPDYPPEICRQYPRTPHRVDGLQEQPLLLSCIEAARLVLLNPELMPQSPPAPYARFLLMPNEAVPHNGRDFRYFWDVRELCLLLVRERKYSLWQRLFLLGMFCKRLGEIVGARDFGLVPKLLRDYAELVAAAKLREEMNALPLRVTPQLQMVTEVAFTYLRRHQPQLCPIRECLQDFLDGLGYDLNPDLDSCTQRYIKAYHEHYEPFLEKYPYVLENYLTNHIFQAVFPFGQDPEKIFDRPEQEFLLLCLEFSVLKGLLIGMAGKHRDGLTLEHVVKLVQSLTKSFEHDLTLGGALNWRGLADGNCVAALLKN